MRFDYCNRQYADVNSSDDRENILTIKKQHIKKVEPILCV